MPKWLLLIAKKIYKRNKEKDNELRPQHYWDAVCENHASMEYVLEITKKT